MTGLGDDPATAAEAEVEVVDEVRRRIVGRASDGRKVEVLAARRDTSMRPGAGVGAGSTDGIIGTIVGFLASIVIDAAVDLAADGRPWKVKVYRPRLVNRRVHSEVLARGEDPEERMRQLLEKFTA